MDWFWFAILSPAIFAFVNILDKFLISKSIKFPIAYAMLIGIIQMNFNVFLLSFFKINFLYPASFIAITSGGLWLFAIIIYIKSLKIEETTKVMSLIFVGPILTAILAFIFLNESFTSFKYIGIGLLVLSAFLISHKKINGQLRFSTALKIIPFAIVIFSTITILEKFALNTLDFISFYFWSSVGAGSVGFLLLAIDKLRLDFGTQFFLIKNKGLLGLAVFIEVLTLIAGLSSFFAISKTYVSYVAALASTQPFFVFIFSLILSLFIPGLIKEDFTRKIILIKLSSVILIIIGGWLIVS
ncbi:MAG: DMT family transporter [Candidatus Aenigmarchaeota archaeon]|nr:DMT family transporter [Candidatus Aenigmarchaeota archaeon]